MANYARNERWPPCHVVCTRYYITACIRHLYHNEGGVLSDLVVSKMQIRDQSRANNTITVG